MKHQTALVTGASSGIGEALCRRLAREGLKLIISGRNKDKLTELSVELGCVIKIIPADLLLLEGREEVIASIHSFIPDLVVNNAGFGLYGEALSYTTEEEVGILEVNCRAVLELTLEAARSLKEKQLTGVVLNVSSVAAYMIFPYSAVYCASKAFVSSFSQSFDLEMEPYGIRVLSANPGMVSTDFSRRAGSEEENQKNPLSMDANSVADDIWKQIVKQKPLQVIDWKYRVLLFVTNIFPTRWVAKMLKRRIQKRLNRDT